MCIHNLLLSVSSQQNRPISAISLVKHVFTTEKIYFSNTTCQACVHNKTDGKTNFCNISCQACLYNKTDIFLQYLLSSVCSQQNRPSSAISSIALISCQACVHNKTDLVRQYLLSSVCSQENRSSSAISLVKRVFTRKQT